MARCFVALACALLLFAPHTTFAGVEEDETLLDAADDGLVQEAEDALNDGADANAADEGRMTPLHYAAKGGHAGVALLLLRHGGNCTLRNDEARRPVEMAAAGPTRRLLAMGPSIPRGAEGDSDWFLAARELVVQAAVTRKKRAAAARRKDCDMLALCRAARNGDVAELAATLKKLKGKAAAKVDVRDRTEATPLHRAAMNGQVEAVALLLAAGADWTLKNGGGRTALQLAAGIAKVEALLRIADASPRKPTKKKRQQPAECARMALCDAAQRGALAEVSRLLDGGERTNDRDMKGFTPLQRAAQGGFAAVVGALLAGKASVNLHGKGGFTALHWAATNGHETALKALLGAKGVRVNAGDDYDYTALHEAASQGHAAVARLLIEAGADVHAKDRDGKEALDLARMDDVQELLEKATGEQQHRSEDEVQKLMGREL